MRILLHVCCGPCALYPVQQLRLLNHEVTGFFHNPNIHPYKEFRRRLETLKDMAAAINLVLEVDDHYGLKDFLRRVVFQEEQRCRHCYAMRLGQAAHLAAAGRYDAFSTTLLYSRYQNHQALREQGEAFAQQVGVPFYYEDFRTGWQQGIDESVRMGLYRQPYCGCIFSEQERYDKQLRKNRVTSG